MRFRIRRGPSAAGLLFSLACAVLFPSNASAQGATSSLRYQPNPEHLEARLRIPQDVPVLRGYRASITPLADLWPHQLPDSKSMPEFRTAAAHVASRLACDGLLPTTARTIEIIGVHHFESSNAPAMQMLQAVGLPVDLYEWFEPPGASGGDAVIAYLTKLLTKGRTADSLASVLLQVPFLPRAAAPGLQVSAEDGRTPPKLVRLQLSKATHWRGPGDGSAVDIAGQLTAALPDTTFFISTSHEAQSDVIKAAEAWMRNRNGLITIIGGPMKPEQWAQDNGKPAILRLPDGEKRIATLAPRYASRGEERTIYDPGETATIEALSAAGHPVVQSPLLFQGGNLLVVDDDGRRTLLVGEAEVLRNTALGLTREQVLHALAVECGVERCLVLPAVSFHIDVELCARRHREGVVFLVNDEAAAARAILTIGMDCLARGGLLEAQLAADVKAALSSRNEAKAVELLAPQVLKLSEGGAYPLTVASHFASGDTDGPAANFERFLLSLDILAARSLGDGEMPGDPMIRAYISSLKRRETERAGLHAMLADEGWRVIAIPSLSDERRGVNYVNGFHVPGRYLMPAYGGIFAALDDAAAHAIRAAFDGEVEVVKIFCGETQRRLGAIHCAASIYPSE